MKRRVAILATILMLVSAGLVAAQTSPEFKLGFKALADQIPDVVGQPLENEHWGANGDSLQQTSTGLMAWRKADNWTAFTNGSRTWVNGPFGVLERANEERFSWEAPATVVVPAPTPAPSPSPSPQPTAAPAPASPQALKLLQHGYGQESSQLAFAFVVENPNPSMASDATPYRAAAYDAAGQLLKTDTGYTGSIMPGQKQGIASTMYLPANTQVARLDVQLDNGRFKSFQPNPGLSADQIAYRQSTQTYLSDKVTAVIRNLYPARLTYVEVSAVCYNSAGTIIGGGFTYMNFLLAGSTSPVEISITTSGVPARIDVYPHVSDLSAIGG